MRVGKMWLYAIGLISLAGMVQGSKITFFAKNTSNQKVIIEGFIEGFTELTADYKKVGMIFLDKNIDFKVLIDKFDQYGHSMGKIYLADISSKFFLNKNQWVNDVFITDHTGLARPERFVGARSAPVCLHYPEQNMKIRVSEMIVDYLNVVISLMPWVPTNLRDSIKNWNVNIDITTDSVGC